MTVASAQSDVADLKASLDGYISDITHTDNSGDPNTQDILQKQATLALENWENAANAVANITASAASNYSNGVGMSLTKRRLDDAMAAATRHMDSFRRACALGGVTVASFEDQGIAFWDLSRASND